MPDFIDQICRRIKNSIRILESDVAVEKDCFTDAMGGFVGILEKDLGQQKRVTSAPGSQSGLDHEQYYRAFDSMPRAYVITDTQGVILHANQAAGQLFRLKASQMTGTRLDSWIDPWQDPIALPTQMGRYEDWSFQLRAVQDRAGVSVTARMVPIFYGGEANILLLWRFDPQPPQDFEDLERKYQRSIETLEKTNLQLQAEMQARKNAEEALYECGKQLANGQVAARIAHEINNPLAGIKNAFALLSTAIPVDHPYYHYVGRIEKEIERIARIVRQMYDLYRPKNDQPVAVDLQRILEDISILLVKGKVELVVDAQDEIEEIFVEQDYLRQILYNLIYNAIEASPYGSIVTVSVRQDLERTVISVHDQGKGIPVDIQNRIFEPLFSTKIDSSRSGIGMGLFISRKLAEAMDACLEFESQAGVGTTFRVILPRKGEPQNPDGS
ncbi:MAG: PAS domain-containing protein [Chloroflexi bacterium]|jgi:signal transduction histidine kinase|nr:PAS domain-containing sensor histidine kinase [Anaerolineaceae bacterium]NMB88461.1 PAS domain-containing protein [Chloroflexota bacterium]